MLSARRKILQTGRPERGVWTSDHREINNKTPKQVIRVEEKTTILINERRHCAHGRMDNFREDRKKGREQKTSMKRASRLKDGRRRGSDSIKIFGV